jgi:hypothetical protein
MSDAQTITPIAFGPAEVAKAVSPPLSGRAVRAALKSGALVSHRIGRARVILREDLIAFIKAQPKY